MSLLANASSRWVGLMSPDMIANTSMSLCVSVRTRLAVSPSFISSNVLFSMRSIPLLRTRSSPDDVIAGVDIFDVPGKRGCAVADQERRNISDVFDAHEPMLGRARARPVQKLVETLDTRCSARLEGTGRHRVDPDALRSEFSRHVSDAALKRGLHRPHKVVLFHDLFSAVEGDRQQAFAVRHERLRQPRHPDERVTRYVHR